MGFFFNLLLESFSNQCLLMVFHWSLSNSKSPQVYWTLCSILAILNNVVAWMISTHLLISKSSSPFNNPLVTVSKGPITIGITVTFMFHSFFQFPSKVQIFFFFFTSCELFTPALACCHSLESEWHQIS